MGHIDPAPPLRIGQAAAAVGLNPKTIRYYEGIGLLTAPRRTSAGYRLYGPADVERLRFIRKAQAIGLTLEEIGEVLALRGQGQRPCGHVLALLDHKLAAVERQLRALEDFRREPLALRDEAAETMTAEACVCGIIELHLSMDERQSPPARAMATADGSLATSQPQAQGQPPPATAAVRRGHPPAR